MMIAANGGTSALWKAFHKAELLPVKYGIQPALVYDGLHDTTNF
jgi:hypothetical protein